VGSGSSGWQRPYSAKRSLICSTSRLQHPQYRGSGKKLRSDHYLELPAPKQHADYRPISITLPYHTNVQTDGAKRGPHIPLGLSDVSRPTVPSDILGSVCFPPQWLHISCHHLPTSHRYQPAAIQSFCRRHITGLFQGVRHHIRHSTLLSKLAELNLPTPVYNSGWLTFSAATRTIQGLVETYRAREASRLGLPLGLPGNSLPGYPTG